MGDGGQAQGGQSAVQAPARPPAYMDAAAGALAGVVARFVVQPLDVLKIRFQVQVEPIQRGASAAAASKYTGLRQALSAIVREEGIRARACGPTSSEGGPSTAVACVLSESPPSALPKRFRPAPPRSRASVRLRCPAQRGATHPPHLIAAVRRAHHSKGAVVRAHAPSAGGWHALLLGRAGARRDDPHGRAAELRRRGRMARPAAGRRRAHACVRARAHAAVAGPRRACGAARCQGSCSRCRTQRSSLWRCSSVAPRPRGTACCAATARPRCPSSAARPPARRRPSRRTPLTCCAPRSPRRASRGCGGPCRVCVGVAKLPSAVMSSPQPQCALLIVCRVERPNFV